MRKRILIALPLIAARADVTVRDVAADGIVAARINGVPARLRIDPAATATPLLSPDLARAAGLKPTMIGVAYGIGPIRVSGASRVARLAIGGVAMKRRVAWADRPYAASTA